MYICIYIYCIYTIYTFTIHIYIYYIYYIYTELLCIYIYIYRYRYRVLKVLTHQIATIQFWIRIRFRLEAVLAGVHQHRAVRTVPWLWQGSLGACNVAMEVMGRTWAQFDDLTMSSMVMFHSEVIFMIKEGMCFFEWELLNHVYPIGMLLNDSCHFLVQLSVTGRQEASRTW